MSDNAQQQSQTQRQQQVMKVVTASWKKFSPSQKNWLTGWMLLILFVALIPSVILWFSTSKEKSLEESNSTLQAENVSLKADNTKLSDELRGLKNLAAVDKQPSASSEGLSLAQVEDAVAKLCGPKEPQKVAKATPTPAKKVVKKVAPPAPQNVAVATQQPQAVQMLQQPSINPQGITQVKFWGWVHPQATPASPRLCFADREITGKPEKCTQVQVFSKEAGETEVQWNARVAAHNGIAAGKKDAKGVISSTAFGRVEVN